MASKPYRNFYRLFGSSTSLFLAWFTLWVLIAPGPSKSRLKLDSIVKTLRKWHCLKSFQTFWKNMQPILGIQKSSALMASGVHCAHPLFQTSINFFHYSSVTGLWSKNRLEQPWNTQIDARSQYRLSKIQWTQKFDRFWLMLKMWGMHGGILCNRNRHCYIQIILILSGVCNYMLCGRIFYFACEMHFYRSTNHESWMDASIEAFSMAYHIMAHDCPCDNLLALGIVRTGSQQ